MNAKRILDVVRESGDANLGQTLLRLARLAEAAHHFQTATDFAGRAYDDARLHSPDVSGRIDGTEHCLASVTGRKDATTQLRVPRSSSICTEVNR